MGYVVVKISGRLLSPPRSDYYRILRDSILEARSFANLAIVCGGGPTARGYIEVLRDIGVSEAFLDIIGIAVSRVNALALALALMPYSPPRPIEGIEEAVEVALRGLIPVLGGLQPGQSTNAVAVALAEALRADIVINMLAGVNGVYVPPPGFEGSRRLDRVSYEELEGVIRRYPQLAGTYELFDNVALKVAERSKIRVLFVDGSDPRVLIRVLHGEKVEGTMLTTT
jgi:uridylate kinase